MVFSILLTELPDCNPKCIKGVVIYTDSIFSDCVDLFLKSYPKKSSARVVLIQQL